MSRVAWLVCGALACGCAHERGLASSGDTVRMKKQLAGTLLANASWPAAVMTLRELAATQPRDADVRVMLGSAYREQGIYDEAEAQYRVAITLDPKRGDAWDGLGVLRDKRGDPGDGALEDLQKAVSLSPWEAAHYNNLGMAYFRRARYLDAVEAYRKGLAKNPTVPRMRNNLGFAYGRLGQFNYARREFLAAGSKGEAENNLGWVYEQSGDVAAACERYREAAQHAPSLDVVKINLARACGAMAAREAPADSTGILIAAPIGDHKARVAPKKSTRRTP